MLLSSHEFQFGVLHKSNGNETEEDGAVHRKTHTYRLHPCVNVWYINECTVIALHCISIAARETQISLVDETDPLQVACSSSPLRIYSSRRDVVFCTRSITGNSALPTPIFFKTKKCKRIILT
mmetsp:Transcript_19280/g.40614  ORF Transcript_19280/g.40614 Transcript_19280/m.40614 type:complete len:123 (-) Transcript_19280:19-387(-)